MLTAESSFWATLDSLLAHPIIIDRPKGKPHPRYPDMIYPLDYGYIEGTNGGDGEGIDVWLGSLEGETKIVGAMATVDSLKYELELKLFINCSTEEIQLATDFLTKHKMGCILILRHS
jgi:inorganic pyrophosphatase